MTEIVNLTPHALDLLLEDGTSLKVPASGNLVRLKETVEKRESIVLADGKMVGVNAKTFGEIEGLPESKDGVIFVVSGIAGTTIWDLLPDRRKDVFIPGNALRDSENKIIGCDGLCCAFKA